MLVIGAGVSGLTTALCLRRRGFAVTVIADRFAPHVTSVVAGALWEWPPAVCGHHHDSESLTRSKAWCEISYRIFADLARDKSTGVFLRPVTFYFKRRIDEDPVQRVKVDELKRRVREFTHDSALIVQNAVNPASRVQDAYRHLAPMIDTDAYMRWLLDEIRRAGCRVVETKIETRLRDQEDTLNREYGVDAIVNCTGLGARELTDDSMYPLRGVLIRVRNDGTTMPRITEAHCVSRIGSGDEHGFIFIVPRGDDTLILGGLAEPDEWDLKIGLDNYEPVREMYQRCVEFLPALKNGAIDSAEPVRVGLRPFRAQGVRLEREPGTRIIHNYGHGGSGVSLSWGCSFETCDLVEKVVSDG